MSAPSASSRRTSATLPLHAAVQSARRGTGSAAVMCRTRGVVWCPSLGPLGALSSQRAALKFELLSSETVKIRLGLITRNLTSVCVNSLLNLVLQLPIGLGDRGGAMFADVQVPPFHCYLTCGLGDRSGGWLRQRRGSPCREWLILRQMAPGLELATLHGLAQLLAIRRGFTVEAEQSWGRSFPSCKLERTGKSARRARWSRRELAVAFLS